MIMWWSGSQIITILFSNAFTAVKILTFFVLIFQPGVTTCYVASPRDLGAQTEVQIRMWPLEYPCVFPIVQFPDWKTSESMPENAERALKTTAVCTNALCVTIHADNINKNSLNHSRWFRDTAHTFKGTYCVKYKMWHAVSNHRKPFKLHPQFEKTNHCVYINLVTTEFRNVLLAFLFKRLY